MMKKIEVIPILIVLILAVTFITCQDEQLDSKIDVEERVIFSRSAEESDPLLDHLLSVEFGEQIMEIGIDKIIDDGLNLQVIDRYTVIQTDPYDPNDFDVDPADPDPPNIVIKLYSEGDGKWPFLPAGIYFLDMDSGYIYDVWGHIVNIFNPWPTLPPP